MGAENSDYHEIFIIMKLSIVKSDSMAPLIEVGDLLKLEKANLNQLTLNSIVVFEYQNLLTAHRVLKINHEKKQAIVKGDNSAHTQSVDFNKIQQIVQEITKPNKQISIKTDSRVYIIFSKLNSLTQNRLLSIKNYRWIRYYILNTLLLHFLLKFYSQDEKK